MPVRVPPASVAATEDFLPLLVSICAVAAIRSPSSSRSILSRNDATRKETVAARITESVTPNRLPGGAAIQIAMMEPGDAGERSPELNSTFVATPVMPPRMQARTSLGFIRTYGK